MRPLHWIAVVVGLAAAAFGLRMIFSPSAPVPAAPDAAAGADGETSEDAPKGSQIELLGGPTPSKPQSDEPSFGSVRSAAEVEGERRKEQLQEVLKNLDGAPIYVEGIDGPTQKDPGAPQRR